jgi:hypothetical protein
LKNVDSVLQFADSAIIGRINYEMRKVLENISNPNTDEKTRKLTIEMDFTPNKDVARTSRQLRKISEKRQ